MSVFKRKHDKSAFFEADVIDDRFDQMMGLVKDLSRKDYNRLKEAMELGYNAYQKVRNIDAIAGLTDGGYMIHDKEGE